MLSQKECDFLHSRMQGTMIEALQMRFIPTEDEFAVAEMPICAATRQYLGILHGGASLTLAETIAGVGSLHLINYDESFAVCGTEVNGSHVAMSATEGKVYGKARLIHGGKSTHVWNVDIVGEDGEIISTERVTNRIIKRK
ncbi:MAG: PaaI family thioesterase [Prevotellaceae bacterium]|nr:PaaI family thioesterase [Candidatus Minthosoma caballi]